MNKVKSVLFAAGVSLALAFTFSCGEVDTGNQSSESSMSSSSFGENGDSSSSITSNLSSSSSGGDSSSSITQSGCPNAVTGNGTVSCGGQTYKTVKIGNQTWMAENLNYNVTGSKCYAEGLSYVSADSVAKNCAKYGRLYDWSTAMSLPSTCNNGPSCASQVAAKHQGICPSGWHIPNDAEWTALTDSVGGAPTAGTKLKATSGWGNYDGKSGSGTDIYGFAALPGGQIAVGDSHGIGLCGYWWSATDYDVSIVDSRLIRYSSEEVLKYDFYKFVLFSVRCLQD